MFYEEMNRRQTVCGPCKLSPPGPQTDYECPFCMRRVTKEIFKDFWMRRGRTQDGIVKNTTYKVINGKCCEVFE